MPSNLNFDAKLLMEAQKIGKFKYKKDAINTALKEYIQKRRQREIKELFGLIDYDPCYDYKARRSRL